MAQVRVVKNANATASLGYVVRTLNANNTQACQLGNLNNAQSTFYRDPSTNNAGASLVQLGNTGSRTIAYITGTGAGNANIQTTPNYTSVWVKSANHQGTLAIQTPSANYGNPNYAVTPNYGVIGYNNAPNYGVGANYGVTGYVQSGANYGVIPQQGTQQGYATYGITGYNNVPNYGVTGSNYGVNGYNNAPNYGVTGSNYGVTGYYQTGANYGILYYNADTPNYGITGYYNYTNCCPNCYSNPACLASDPNYGVTGYNGTNPVYGVTGYNNAPNYGVTGYNYGVTGYYQTGANYGVTGSNYGVTGYYQSGTNYGFTGYYQGFLAYNNAPVYGITGYYQGVIGYYQTGSNYGVTGYYQALTGYTGATANTPSGVNYYNISMSDQQSYITNFQIGNVGYIYIQQQTGNRGQTQGPPPYGQINLG